MNKNSGKKYIQTGFNHGSRRAGHGMVEDDYSEESYGGWGSWGSGSVRVKLPHDDVKPEELNGECIIVQAGRKD